ncbi:hypothetical protein JCM11491_001755 [Sporobolomyces phaffii]
MSDDFDEVWHELLKWLRTFEGSTDVERHVRLVHNAAGRGLVARTDLPPSTLLISIPNAALLNLYTLTPLYPPSFTLNGRLNATQLISLHLALQFRQHLFTPAAINDEGSGKGKATESLSKKQQQEHAARDKFWPFLATLPRSFPSHPLTWSVLSQSDRQLAKTYSIADGGLKDTSMKGRRELPTSEREKYSKVLEAMGPGLRRRVDQVEKRFRCDWTEVLRAWTESGSEVGDVEFGFHDFLLGWLNVNTRCIYFDLPTHRHSPSHWTKKDNSLTLCPVIDMINHKSSLSTKPHPTPTALTFSSPSRSSPDDKVVEGDELKFSYGGHDDEFLLSEYGFVIGDEENEYNSVNVDKYVEALFASQGREGELKRAILEEKDYWGDMTFQSHPTASPSWRVLVALRLFHLRLPSSAISSSTSALSLASAESLAPFYDVLTGTIDQISHANESKVRSSVKAIATNLVIETRGGIERCDALEREWRNKQSTDAVEGEGGRDDLFEWLKMVKEIWTGEGTIAKAIAEQQ